MPTAIRSDKINLSSEKKTEEFANKFLKKLEPGYIVFLYGEMGVGKTTFIKHLVNAFQQKNKVKITEVTSPTFNLLNQYDVNKFIINHYDLFRLKNDDELKNLGLFEDNLNAVTLIEWPEIIQKKPEKLIELFFKYEDNYKKRSALIKGIKDGLIDVIVSDHKPEDEESKRLPFAQAAEGSIGIETLLSLALELYHNESLSLKKIIETITCNPAKILKINKGTLKKGSDADLCIFDLNEPWKVDVSRLKSKSKNAAIENRKLQGKVLMTYLKGESVFNLQ